MNDLSFDHLSWKQSILRLFIGLGYYGVYQLSQRYLPLSYLLTDDFKSYNFVVKLTLIVLIAKLVLCKYLAGWAIAVSSPEEVQV